MNKSLSKRWLGLSSLVAAMLVVAGCSLAPTYERADVNAPAAFKETPVETMFSGRSRYVEDGAAVRRGDARRMVDDLRRRDAQRSRTARPPTRTRT